MDQIVKRKVATDFDQGLLDIFDEYIHGIIERREFLEKAGKFAEAIIKYEKTLSLAPDHPRAGKRLDALALSKP